ncbi:MAG TPA: hypothetical protein VFP84_36410 [Kofleriaceae bacterium]|nr:hypothetical protein [Kofleriaceae bacterium]
MPGKQTLVPSPAVMAPAPAASSAPAASTASSAASSSSSSAEPAPPQDRALIAVRDKLTGLDALYKLFRTYRALDILPEADAIHDQLARELPRFGFASVEAFAGDVDHFARAFEAAASRIALDLLARYAAVLAREAQRYRDPAVVKVLHQRLAGFRASEQTFRISAPIWNAYAARADHDAEARRLPGGGGVHVEPPSIEQLLAKANAQAARAGAEVSIDVLARDYPIFAEQGLPTALRIDKTRLAAADERGLARQP